MSGFFGAYKTTRVQEVTLFDVPAIGARSSISFAGEPPHPFQVTPGIRDVLIFILVLHAPGEEELEAFLPTWQEMIDGIQPTGTNSDAFAAEEETAESDWEMISSVGDALCADGSPSAFWIRLADQHKLFIYFQGPYHNTFCRDAENCDLDTASPWIDPAIHPSEQFDQSTLRDIFADEPGRLEAEILDLSNPDSPLFGCTAVYIPYCTGDLFMGDITQTYTREDGTTFDIYHHGCRNAQAVLDIVYENITAPDQILIAGCEAGALGTLPQAPSLIEHYPNASLVQLSEGFAGVFPDRLDFDAAWGVRQNFPDALNNLPEKFTMTDLTSAIALEYPLARFAQFNYVEDGVQATAYSTGGLSAYRDLEIAYEDFARELTGNLDTIHNSAANFHSFTRQGTRDQPPCALDSSLVYWLEGGDTFYVDWLSALLAGEDAVDINGDYSFEAR